MKKLLCFLLPVLMIIGIFPMSISAKTTDIKVVNADVFSSECAYDTCRLYLSNEKFYIDVSDVKRYTRTEVNEDGNSVILTHGSRKININTSSGLLTEDNIKTNISVIKQNDKTLIHAFPLLTYLGASCGVEESRLVIAMPERTMWEGLVRISGEDYFTLETFGSELEQQTRLVLNGILKILESGLSEALFTNAMKDAFVEAMQIDPLKYDGSWTIKEKSDEKYGSMISAMIAANDFSPEFNEVFSSTSSLISNIAIEYLKGANEDDAEFVVELKGVEGLFSVVSTASSFLSNLSTNSKCTSDSLAMVKAFSKHTEKNSKYYNAANSVQSKVESDLTATLDAARDVAKGKIADKLVDKANEQLKLGKSGYLSVTALIEESINISVMLHKLFYGENNAFAYSSAETSAINLLMLKNELRSSMTDLGNKIVKENYSNKQDIEDYRLLNVFYYRVLIAANENLEKMIIAQGRANENDMAEVIAISKENNNLFAKNLYILINSSGNAFADISKLSNSNDWDKFETLKSKATEISESSDLSMYYLSIQNGQYAISGDYKYCTIQTGNDGIEPTGDLYKINLKTNEKTLLKKDTLAQFINVVGDKVFYTLYGSGPYNVGIHMISTDGAYHKLSDEFISGLAADDTYVYYATDGMASYDGRAAIYRMNYTNNETEKMVELDLVLDDLSVVGDRIVYSEIPTMVNANKRIVMYDINSGTKTLVPDMDLFEEMWVHGDYIYVLKWDGSLSRSLYRYNIITQKLERCVLPDAECISEFFGVKIGDLYSNILEDFEEELPNDFALSSKFNFSPAN